MKFTLFSLVIVSACSSSGVEPQWNRTSAPQTPTWSASQLSNVKNLRVEMRKRESGTGNNRNIQFSFGKSNSSKLSNNQSNRSSSSTAFSISVPGGSSHILLNNQQYSVKLGRIQQGQIQASISNASTNSQRINKTYTTLIAPVGRWISVSGISDDSRNASSSSQLGSSYKRKIKHNNLLNNYGLEIRITPL